MKFNGPPPQPTALRLLRGNPGKRPLPQQAVKPTPGADCPKILSPAARAEWKRLQPELLRLGLLTQIDRAVLAAYCEAWSDFLWAVNRIRQSGRLTTAGNGTLIPHPAVQIKRASMKLIKDLSAEFGFSPAALARIDLVAPDGDADDDEKFFGPQGSAHGKKKTA